jgi:hypothetical protein
VYLLNKLLNILAFLLASPGLLAISLSDLTTAVKSFSLKKGYSIAPATSIGYTHPGPAPGNSSSSN